KIGAMGFVADFGEVKKLVKDVLSRLDHTYLNESMPAGFMPPSAEQIASFVYHELASSPLMQHLKLRVKVFESQKTWAEYSE
ncbi:MAG: 6-carboxytetrahydropterin synthase, partial [Thermoprotei archaeon]